MIIIMIWIGKMIYIHTYIMEYMTYVYDFISLYYYTYVYLMNQLNLFSETNIREENNGMISPTTVTYLKAEYRILNITTYLKGIYL